MFLMNTFCKVRELVLDTCAGTLPTIKVCLPLSEHPRTVGYEKDSARFQDVLPLLMEVYGMQVVSPGSNIAGCEEAVRTSKMFVTEMEAPAPRRGLIDGLYALD